MAFFSLLAAVIIFLLGALAPVFDFNFKDFSPLYWGLFFFSLSFLVPSFVDYRNGNRRV